MRAFLTFILIIMIGSLMGQNTGYKAFNKSSYPASKYSIQSDTFNFHGLKINVIHVKLKNPSNEANNDPACRVWLLVKKDSTLIDKLYYNGCESLGGCSGIYVAKQTTSKYFILSKFGDYDGRIILLDTLGKIQHYRGGGYYLSPDKHYLFSIYDSDLDGITVLDLAKGEMLFSSQDLKFHPKKFYSKGNDYFASVDMPDSDVGYWVKFDFTKNTFITLDKDMHRFGDWDPLVGYNLIDVLPSPCACGNKKSSKKIKSKPAKK